MSKHCYDIFTDFSYHFEAKLSIVCSQFSQVMFISILQQALYSLTKRILFLYVPAFANHNECSFVGRSQSSVPGPNALSKHLHKHQALFHPSQLQRDSNYPISAGLGPDHCSLQIHFTMPKTHLLLKLLFAKGDVSSRWGAPDTGFS